MAYSPHTAGDRERMLEAIGARSIDDLFADIPAQLRASGLNLPAPDSEVELAARLRRLASTNRVGLAGFLGAGAYRHFSPAVVDQLLLRGEFYTAYTPYQPEISQGTLQTIYEYQSMMAELTGLDVVSASHYDGATATAEGSLMACRATRRSRVLVSAAVHPHYRETLCTYFGGAELVADEIPLVAEGPEAGTTDLAALEAMLGDPQNPVAGVVVANPSFLGLLEPMAEIGRLAHAAGALLVAVIEPVSLAVLATPGQYDADIAAGEGQPLGIPLSYGGPYLGILACREALVRQIPGRLVGMTTDVDGRRAFVMTLRAREQDIRREKAASNICTNQALCALAAGIYLSSVGPHGLRDVAALSATRAAELERELAAAGAPRVHSAPYLYEYAVHVPNARAVHKGLLDRGILAGLPLGDYYPGDGTLADALLVCATEVTTSEEIAAFGAALRAELEEGTEAEGGPDSGGVR
jgi:glycine dehydrogenase subunit 1